MPLGPVSQPGASARLPTAPTSISATAVSGGQASISFTPSTNPGKPSGNYVVTSSPGSLTASGASSPITVTGLATGTAYTFTVVKQSGSGISSATSGASGSITAFVPPTFGTQTGSSTATPPSGGSTTGISNVYTTTGTLSKSIGAGATFYDYERISGTGGGASGDSLSGLAEDTDHEWRVRVTNNSSSFALTTSFTPNGSATTISVAFGTDGVTYASSASVVSGSTSGSGTSAVTTSWTLGSSTSATIYWRATATYAGGATVQTTGTISRAITVSNGTSTGVFRTYTTRTKDNVSSLYTISRPSYGANIEVTSAALLGGGGGGGNLVFNGSAGGGGGQFVSVGAFSSTGTITISRGGPGGVANNGYATTLTYPVTTHSAGGGFAGNGVTGGNSGGPVHPGAGGPFGIYGGGGAGAGGGATNQNGGPSYFGVGPGGPGGSGYSAWGSYQAGTSAGTIGAGGRGEDGTGHEGSWSITYVGPNGS
jgi:hypothetical protein